MPGGVTSFTSISSSIGIFTCGIANTGRTYCWGVNTAGQMGNGTVTASELTPVAVSLPGGVTSFTSISTGNQHACAIANTGATYCWGHNRWGSIGNGTTTPAAPYAVPTPTAVSLPVGVTSFTNIRAGGFHTCGIANTGAAYCWGNNQTGQVGKGSTTASPFAEPTPVAVSLPVGVTSFTALYLGADSVTCGTANTGALYCWGQNSFNLVGNGTTTPSEPTPMPVTMPAGVTSFTSVDIGFRMVCGIGNDGIPYCWGNSLGALGNVGSSSTSSVPQPITMPPGISSFTKISLGYNHSCGIANTNHIYCWGWNGAGSNIFNSTGYDWRDIPTNDLVMPVGVTSFTNISAGEQHACGIANTGAAYCWGYNGYGAVGKGTTNSSYPLDEPTPIAVTLPVGVTSFTTIMAGGAHTCGIANTGAAYCWGNNMYGQTGKGSITASPYAEPTPIPVTLPVGVSSFTTIRAGLATACGIANTGTVYCWGYNPYGQLGNDTMTTSGTPPSYPEPTPLAVTMPVGVSRFNNIEVGGYTSYAW